MTILTKLLQSTKCPTDYFTSQLGSATVLALESSLDPARRRRGEVAREADSERQHDWSFFLHPVCTAKMLGTEAVTMPEFGRSADVSFGELRSKARGFKHVALLDCEKKDGKKNIDSSSVKFDKNHAHPSLPLTTQSCKTLEFPLKDAMNML